MGTVQPERIEAMVVVSSTMYFPEQARSIMRQISPGDHQPLLERENDAQESQAGRPANHKPVELDTRDAGQL
jgi:hypothetical protein